MPSRILADPQGPHIAEFTALPTQHDDEMMALPDLQEVEIVYETEYVLDFRGRRRLDREVNDQQYYIGQPEDTSPSYSDFPMPGLASADTLRDFLRQHLLPDQIVDEYGNQCAIADISNDHLPSLQAKLWVSPVKETTQYPSRAQNLIAAHVSKILQLLEKKHVFKFSEAIKKHACDYRSDLQTTTEHMCHPRIVRLEPLVHWGTVTPAEPLQYILPFRHDGEIITNMDKAEFKLYVRRLVDANAPSYCIDCLGHLWSKRSEAQDTIRQLQESALLPQYRFSEDNFLPRPVIKRRHSGSRVRDAGTLAVGETVSTTATRIEAAMNRLDERLDKALPQLDGACDRLDISHMDHASTRDKTAIWFGSNSDEPTGKLAVHKRPSQRTDSFTRPLRTPPSSTRYPTTFPPLTRSPASTTTESSNAKEENTSESPKRNSPGPQVIDLTTPPPVKERKFGQELNTNTKALFIDLRRSPRNHKTNMLKSQEFQPAPVEPIKPLRGVQEIEAAPKRTKKTKMRKNASVGQQAIKQKKSRKTLTKHYMSLAEMDAGPNSPAPQDMVPSRPRLELSLPERLQLTTRPASAVGASSHPQLTVHFAKRSGDQELSDSIAEEEWQVFQSTHPTSTSKICFCNKPACHGKFKKGEEPQIAQCVGRDCRFRWFHYACLDVSEKGKARWGTLLCSICRVEQELVERDRKNGWTVDKMTSFQPVWTKGHIEQQLPGLGGVITQANPYGLGSKVQFEPKYERQIKETGTLGELQKLGYPQSRPEMLEEAYLHAGAYVELLARRTEQDQDVEGEDETYKEEEEEDYDGNVYDEEMDECL